MAGGIAEAADPAHTDHENFILFDKTSMSEFSRE